MIWKYGWIWFANNVVHIYISRIMSESQKKKFTVGLVHYLREPEEKCLYVSAWPKPLTSQKPKNRASLTAGCDFWETLMWSSPIKKAQQQQWKKFCHRDLRFFWGDLSTEDFSLGSLRQIITHWTQPWRSQRSRLSPPILQQQMPHDTTCHRWSR